MAKKLKKDPKSKAVRKKPLTLDTALKQIEKMLLLKNVGGPLWDVLSALRGPDVLLGTDDVKTVYTIPVRRAAFPKLIYGGHNCAASFNSGYTNLKLTSAGASDTGGRHYGRHIRDAVDALKFIGRTSE